MILSCLAINLNAASQEPLEECMKNALINAFAQAGTDSIMVTDAAVKFEADKVDVHKGNQCALIDWILFSSIFTY